MTEDKMVWRHHWLDGHEFEQAPEIADGQVSLTCCSPWGRKESDMTEQLNWIEKENSIDTAKADQLNILEAQREIDIYVGTSGTE